MECSLLVLFQMMDGRSYGMQLACFVVFDPVGVVAFCSLWIMCYLLRYTAVDV